MRLIGGVRAVLARPMRGHRETDRLAATLAWYWGRDAEPGSPLARFARSGAISQATVDALYDDLVAVQRSGGGGPRRREGDWTVEAIVWALLEYAAVHWPRGAVADWAALRDDRIAARVLGDLLHRPRRP